MTDPRPALPAWTAAWVYPWRLLKEPRTLSAVMALVYLDGAFAVGLQTILYPLETALGQHIDVALARTVGVMALLGGILALASLWGGAWVIERTGIAFLIGGLLARAVIVWYLPWDASTIVRLGEISMIIGLLIARTIRIWGLDLDPTRG